MPDLECELVTIALDVDGVLLPVTVMNSGVPSNRHGDWEYILASERNFGCAVAEPVIKAVRAWHEAGANVQWHTSWREAAPDTLAPELGLPNFTLFATQAEYEAHDPWWKLAAVRRWLSEAGEGETLVWVDDDIADSLASGEITEEEAADPRLVLVSPDTWFGLSPDDLDTIWQIVAKEAGERE